MRCEHGGVNVVSFFIYFILNAFTWKSFNPTQNCHLRPHPAPFYRDFDPDPDLTYCIQEYRLIGP